MSLKKLLPLIIVLISISLIGVVYLQYNRLKNLRIVRNEQFSDRIALAVNYVAVELSQAPTRPGISKPRRRTTISLGSNPGVIELAQPVLISERFTAFEIQEKFVEAFRHFNLPVKQFEFGITNTLELLKLELYSKGFHAAAQDTINNKQWIYPLDPPQSLWYEDVAPYENIVLIIPQFSSLVSRQSLADLVGAVVFTLFIMFAFFLTIRTMVNQKKLSEIKNDFINNMTHEFKTPLATISLAVDALANEKVLHSSERREYFRGIIKDENKRMNKHVETILQAAALEKQDLQMSKSVIPGHDLIQRAMDNYRLVMQQKNGEFVLQLNARNDLIEADEQHMTNLISNLLDNAIKYSKDEPHVTITTHSTPNHFILRVDDRGIGMSRESVKRIFEKFYRAHTGNLHNVKGFGLGMSYVKTIADAHKARVRVDSTLGKGTSFTLEIPLANQ